jgi:hypothetical protein
MSSRTRLPELHDLRGCPAVWRDLLTDFMSQFTRVHNPYAGIVVPLGEAMQRAGTRTIVDLCSGAGEPAVGIQKELKKAGLDICVILTDKYPNLAAFRKWKVQRPDGVDFLESSVDAQSVPRNLAGFRTLFTSFHHFDPESARRVLADSLEKRQGIGIFEYTERNFWIWGLPLIFTPFYIWLTTPFMRPFRWSRLLWTYLLPVVPLMAVCDGFVSCLRTYSPLELEEMVRILDVPEYVWETGRVRSIGLCRVTYLLGYPDRAA